MRRTGVARVTLLGAMVVVAGASFALLGCTPEQAPQTQEEDPGMTQVMDPEQDEPEDGQKGLSATVGDYSFVVDGFSMDENGCGYAEFTLSNPNGIGGTINESGEFVSEGASGIDALQMLVGDDDKPSALYVMDEDSADATEAHGRICFDTRGIGGVPCDLSWVVIAHEGEGDSLSGNEEATGSTGVDYALTPVQAYSSDDGASASLSPLGIVLSTGVDTDKGQFIDERVTLQLEDGSEVVVLGGGDAVSATQGMRPDGSSSYAFLSNLSVEDVVSVTLEGTLFGIDSEQSVTYVLTPAS